MGLFFARVELHDADDDDYAALHKAMRKIGFEPTIQGKTSLKKLPTGLYRYEGERECDAVRDRVHAAADSTGRDSSLIVIETKSWAANGLKKKT